MSPPSVPPQAPSSDRPLPSAGSPGGSSPTSSVPSADSDFSPPLAPRFVSFARHYHRFALFRSPGAGRFPVGLDHFYRGARAAESLYGGEDEIPGSWTTLAYMPRSPTPADRRPPGHYRDADGAFRVHDRVGSAMRQFRASIAPSRGLHALCVRFEAGVTPGQRNTRFRLVASLGRAGLSPAGSHRWFTVMSFRLHGVLHHQALPGAT